MRKPNLDLIIKMLEKGKTFRITRAEYIKLTGADIPQQKSYTEKRSAVAKQAHEYGYDIEVIPEILIFKRR